MAFTCVEAYKGHDRYSFIAPQIALVAAADYGCSLMLYQHKRWRIGCLAVPVLLSCSIGRTAAPSITRSGTRRDDQHRKNSIRRG
jgi:hypothetical protein